MHDFPFRKLKWPRRGQAPPPKSQCLNNQPQFDNLPFPSTETFEAFQEEMLKSESSLLINEQVNFSVTNLDTYCLMSLGCWLLVIGYWLLLLVIGCRLLVVGCWMLAVGCWLLVVA